MSYSGDTKTGSSDPRRKRSQVDAGEESAHMNDDAKSDPARSFTPLEQKPEVSMEVAASLDLRVGTIVDVAEVAGADRLARLTVDFGRDTRTVIAGIRQERPDLSVLIGRQALFYYNLPRKKIRGQLSEAMLCDLGFADGILPALLQPEWPVPNGTRAG